MEPPHTIGSADAEVTVLAGGSVVGSPPAQVTRPTWRGVIHRWAAITAVPLFGLLIALASGTGDRVAVIVYAVAVTTMLGVSATYHSGRLAPRAFARMKRVDHGTILLGIAGSYTAFCTIGLDGTAARRLLTVIWVAAAIGVVIRMTWLRAPYPVVAVVYLVVGWSALIEWSALNAALTGVQMTLLIGGGALYTAGAVVYALHKPNPRPATFGYHEVFHALVVAGATAHYVAILSLELALR